MPRHPVILSANDVRSYDPEGAAAMVERLLLEGDSTAPAGGAYDLLGQVYLVAGDLRSARDAFMKDLEVYPDSHSTFLYMGLVEEIEGDQAKAKEWYRKAPERGFDDSYTYGVRSACREWERTHRRSESRIAMIDAGRKPPPLLAKKRWWQFWRHS